MPYESIDPVLSTQGSMESVKAGFMTLSQALKDTGYSVGGVMRQQAEEAELKRLIDIHPIQISLIPYRTKAQVTLVSIEGEPKMKWQIVFQRLALLAFSSLIAITLLLNLEVAFRQ